MDAEHFAIIPRVALFALLLVLLFGVVAFIAVFAVWERLERVERKLREVEARLRTGSMREAEESKPRPSAPDTQQTAVAPPPALAGEIPAAVEIPPSAPPPSRSADLEVRLGASLPIWIGAISLALSGVFLVKYAVEHQLLGPGARVSSSVVLGSLALAAGWRLRERRPSIAQGLAASGVAILSAAIWAASWLYGFLGPVVAIACQGLLTAVAVWLSLRLGPFVAMLGVVGGFLQPALCGTGAVTTAPLLLYLVLLQGGLTAFARRARSGWWVLPLGALGALIWLFTPELRGGAHWWLGPFSLFVAATGFVVPDPPDGAMRQFREAWRAIPLLASTVVLFSMWNALDDHDLVLAGWIWLFVASLGALAFAAFRREAALQVGLCAVALGTRIGAIDPLLLDLPSHGLDRGGYALLVSGYFVVFALGGDLVARMRRADPVLLGVLSGVSAIAAGLLADRVALPLDVAAPVAAGMLVAAMRFGPRASLLRDGGSALREACIACAVVFLCWLWLARVVVPGWRVPAQCGLLLGWAVFLVRRRLPTLLVPFPILLLVEVVLGLVDLEPPSRLILSEADRPLLLDPHFALPLAITAVAARVPFLCASRFRMPGTRALLVTMAAFGVVATLIEGSDEVLSKLAVADPGFVEQAIAGSGAMLLALMLRKLRCLDANDATIPLARSLFRVGAGWHVVVGLMVVSPLHEHVQVGSIPIFNALSPGFGAGAVLAVVYLRADASASRTLRGFAVLCALLLCFAWVTLQVRQAFQGSYLDGPLPSRAEWYAYSAAWLVLGGVLLAFGIRRKLRALRQAALLTILLAVIKVFLFDARHLDGLWRVASFLGLGVCLIGLAWAYQRFVVGERSQAD